MRRVNSVCPRGVGFRVVRLLVLFFLLSLSLSHAEEDDAPRISGVPPGIDVRGRPGVGQPPQSQGRLTAPPPKKEGKFHLVEATIADIHRALQRRELTCEGLIRLYFKRIKA